MSHTTNPEAILSMVLLKRDDNLVGGRHHLKYYWDDSQWTCKCDPALPIAQAFPWGSEPSHEQPLISRNQAILSLAMGRKKEYEPGARERKKDNLLAHKSCEARKTGIYFCLVAWETTFPVFKARNLLTQIIEKPHNECLARTPTSCKLSFQLILEKATVHPEAQTEFLLST